MMKTTKGCRKQAGCLWSCVRDVGEYCQTNFQATNVDLATLRQGLETHLQAHLPQHLQKVSEAMCETQPHNDAIFSNMQHSLQALSHQLEPITAIFLQLQQKWHEPAIKNNDLGQFSTLEQLSALATAFQEAQQRLFHFSGGSANFARFSAQANECFVHRTYVQQLEESFFSIGAAILPLW